MSRPDVTNHSELRATPSRERTRAPTEGQLATYQTGPDRFFNLARRGSFRTWPLEGLFRTRRLDGVLASDGSPLYQDVIIDGTNFNCFAWSLGHTDRWIEGGSVEQMEELYTTYHFEKCTPEEADVELYRLLNAPPVLYSRRGRPYDNPASKVKHAHRRDRPELDNVPQLGCSSKLGVGSLILHNRSALADDRDWDAHSPAPQYGAIYQYWRRTSKHPSKSGMQNNLRDPTGNYPDSAIFAQGYGKYPPGHPGNTIGLKLGNNQLPPGPSGPNEQAKESRGWFSRSKDDKKKSSAPQKFPQSTSTTSQARNPQPSYARAPRIRPYDPIPPPRRAACHSAVQMYNTVCKSNPRFVNEFETRFHAWKNTWYSSTSGRMDAKSRCRVVEFDRLLQMGAAILPLVVYRLLDRPNFTAVFLYNALEKNTRYLIDPRDVLNFLVLQRQNNLIIDLNQDRKW